MLISMIIMLICYFIHLLFYILGTCLLAIHILFVSLCRLKKACGHNIEPSLHYLVTDLSNVGLLKQMTHVHWFTLFLSHVIVFLDV